MNEKVSILLTSYGRRLKQPLSELKIGLGSILKNSHFREHEIVFVGDCIDIHFPKKDNGYSSIKQCLEEYWIPKFEKVGFTFSLYIGDWSEFCVNGKSHFECWSHGAEKAKNDWLIPCSCDHYYAPNWDLNLIRRIGEYGCENFVYQMVQCDMYLVPSPEVFDVQNRSHALWKKPDRFAGYKGIHMEEDEFKKPLKESLLMEHYKQNMKDGVYIEGGGPRRELSWFSSLRHKKVVDKIRERTFNHEMFDWRRTEPNKNNSLDMVFDEMLGVIGVKKVGCLDSFLYHVHFHKRVGRFIFDLGES